MSGRPAVEATASLSADLPVAVAAGTHTVLTQVPINQPVRLCAVDAAVGLRQRLSGMGFIQGAELEVIKQPTFGQGPLVVRLGDCRLALGFQLARHIQVEALAPRTTSVS